MAFNTVLITGISGSGGSYLAEYIAEVSPSTQIHGMSRWHSTPGSGNLDALAKKAVFHECDLLDFSTVLTVLQRVKPDAIFHLASHANVRVGFVTPLAVLHNNIMGTANLFEAIRISGQQPTILHCSTSEVYGQVDPANVPINESCPICPSSPYAVSKATQDHLAYTYWRCYGMRMVRTRMFSYINPRRADLFATAFARQIARIEAGLQVELLHGNLESTRTIIDVRDAMSAYWIAAHKGEPGEVYNIGGESVVSVGEFLKVLIEKATVPIRTRVDQALLRPADVTLQIPNTSKFHDRTGWRPQFSFEDSVQFLLDRCRMEVQKNLCG